MSMTVLRYGLGCPSPEGNFYGMLGKHVPPLFNVQRVYKCFKAVLQSASIILFLNSM